jgi:hypothetical protein
MNHDVSQVIGALFVLCGFAGAQLGWVGPKSIPYLIVNILGAGLLAWLAWTSRDWGFLLLEGVWTLVSVIALAGVFRARAARPALGAPELVRPGRVSGPGSTTPGPQATRRA